MIYYELIYGHIYIYVSSMHVSYIHMKAKKNINEPFLASPSARTWNYFTFSPPAWRPGGGTWTCAIARHRLGLAHSLQAAFICLNPFSRLKKGFELFVLFILS